MAVVAVFNSDLTPDEYDRIIKELDARGHGTIDGRISHLAWSTPEGWRVVDVWESEEKLGRFAEILMPLMADLGVSVPPPAVYTVHNIL